MLEDSDVIIPQVFSWMSREPGSKLPTANKLIPAPLLVTPSSLPFPDFLCPTALSSSTFCLGSLSFLHSHCACCISLFIS